MSILDQESHLEHVPSSVDKINRRPSLTAAEQKRVKRKRKSPVNFRLNKILVRAESIEEVLDLIGESINDFNIVNIGTALYRLALVGGVLATPARDALRQDERFCLLIAEIVETLQGDNDSESLQHIVLAPKELSNIIWAATKLGLNDPVLFDAVAKHVRRYMEHFDSVNLSLTLWGFAKMDMRAPDMFDSARSRVTQLLPEFEPHRICNTVWAFAKTGNTDLDLFKSIAEESIRKLHRFNHSNESMLLYSYALGHVHAPILFRKAMAQQLPAIKSGEVQDPRSLSNLLWAISELNLSGEFRELYDVVSTSAITNIHRYSLTHMATVGSAYAKADVRADELFNLMATEAATRTFDDQSQWADLVVLNEAFVHFDIDSGVVKETISRVKHEQQVNEHQERQVKIKNLVTDLVSTSAIAAFVLIIAALLRMYFTS